MKRIVLLSFAFYLWFLISGFYPAIAGAPDKAAYTAYQARNPFSKQLIKEIPLADPAKKIKAKAEVKKVVVPPLIAVDGMITGRVVPYAIISGKIFTVGDKIGEALIAGITKEGVEVLYNEEKFFYPAPSKALVTKREAKNAR